MNRILLYVVFFVFLLSCANAQDVRQSGTVTPGHVTRWITNGVVGDGGPLGGGASFNGTFNAFDFLCANSTSVTPLIIDCGISRDLVPLLGAANTWTGSENVNSYGGTAGTLFSNAHYGECLPNPPTSCDGQGFFTSAGTTLNERYISNYFAQTAIYANTTRDATQGETGLYLTMATSTGYQPPGSTTGQKAALQISGFAYPGGGAFWDAAMSAEYKSGWSGASGNFGAVLELDPTNNDVEPVPVEGSNTTLVGLWLAGQIGTHPITSFLQITPNPNGAVFGSIYGIYIAGDTAIKQDTIHDATHSFASYTDIGVHTTGIALSGTYSAFQIAGTEWGVDPTGLLIGQGLVARAAAPTVGVAQIGYGSTVVAAGAGTCPTGTVGGSAVAGCIVVNIAGTAKNVPYF